MICCFSHLCRSGQTLMLIFSVITILFGAYVQYLSFPEIKWLKDKNIDENMRFMIFLGLMVNPGGVVFFGRPYWPLLIQLFCCVCSFFIMAYMVELAGWWERTTVLLIFCVMIGEFLYQRRRGGES